VGSATSRLVLVHSTVGLVADRASARLRWGLLMVVPAHINTSNCPRIEPTGMAMNSTLIQYCLRAATEEGGGNKYADKSTTSFYYILI